MGEIAVNIDSVKKELPHGVKLIAVSKTKPPETILEAYKAGQKAFGENKAQELVYKHESLPKDIEWHMIGHLQTNKVKYIAPFVQLIHAVDSLKLLKAINSEAIKNHRVIDCLIQVKIAREETKYGLSFNEVIAILNSSDYAGLSNIRVTGLMGMATFTEDIDQVRKEFRELNLFFHQLKKVYFADKPYFSEISMGMSDDYPIAIEEGATMVRIGSNIFGNRIYI
ncbi:MAG: YggS family pyridoxal phosphate-dependent enzyme [Bacteroidales bacterium]|nr:YggS family pyridoxal phosphate-dependent enzyme [Bacteroidales bacterium]